jgi:two-component system, NtrC family, response regulator AlgB
MPIFPARADGGKATPALALDVLVVDDDRSLRRTVRVCLEALACTVDEAPSAAAARDAAERRRHDLVLLDLRLGRDDGLDLLPLLRASTPGADVVVITAFPAVESAVEAMRRGAHDYLVKPFTPLQIQQLAERTAARRRLAAQLADGRRARLGDDLLDLHTESPAMRQALDRVTRAAATDAPILLYGEPGTGKARVARRLHALGARAAQPFVAISAAAGDEARLHATLFGRHGTGDAEPPALARRVDLAAGGTLFVREPALLAPSLQRELLRLIDERSYLPLGASEPRPADVRVVLASTRDLAKEVQAGRFDRELRARLCELRIPPLRERREDILPLARRVLARCCGNAMPAPEITLEAESALLAHAWPGNLHELAQAMEQAALLRTGLRVGLEALPEPIAGRAAALPYLGGEFTLDAIEREHILRVLARASSQEEAARVLGIDDSTLWRKKKRYER